MTNSIYSTQDLVKLIDNEMVGVDISRFMTKQGIKPLHTYKAGRGEVRLWAAAAKDALVKYRADIKAKHAPAPAVQVMTTNEAPDWARALARDMPDHHGANTALMESVRLCHAQNAALLKAIERIGMDLSAKIAALQGTVDTPMVADPHTPEPTHKPIPTVLAQATSVAPLRKIAIIGLLSAQKQVIEKEFSQAFDIRFYEVTDAKGRAFSDAVSRCEAAFLMISFVNHSIGSSIKATGTRIIKVPGGMSSLCDKLTELYVTPEPAKPLV
jgi:hypothetical protein